MTRGDIKDLIGRKTNIMNSSGTIVDGLVTDDDLDVFIQMRYREMFNVMAEKYPENFEVTTTWDNVLDTWDGAYWVLTSDATLLKTDSADSTLTL